MASLAGSGFKTEGYHQKIKIFANSCSVMSLIYMECVQMNKLKIDSLNNEQMFLNPQNQLDTVN